VLILFSTPSTKEAQPVTLATTRYSDFYLSAIRAVSATDSPTREGVKLVVLYTSGENPDWPDALDEKTGLFTYYGDNRSPGRLLHETSRSGNIILRDTFAAAHADEVARQQVLPCYSQKLTPEAATSCSRGPLAPGADTLAADDDLQAIWRSTGGQRFQNYRVAFTVLDTPVVSRPWIDQVLAGHPLGDLCPPAWAEWVRGRAYRTLVAPATKAIRSRAEQSAGRRRRPADPQHDPSPLHRPLERLRGVRCRALAHDGTEHWRHSCHASKPILRA
jgi:hypothetical protein